MHEHSLVKSLLSQVSQLAAEHAADAVEEIVVAAGPLAGVEPLLLASAFEQLATDDLFRLARLTIDEPSLELGCQSCGTTFESDVFVFACPACGSQETRVICGDGLILRRVVLRLPQLVEASA